MRLEDALDVLDPGAVVFDADCHPAILGAGAQPQHAPGLAHGLEGVVDHVEEDALDLVGVGLHLGGVRGQVHLDVQPRRRALGVG